MSNRRPPPQTVELSTAKQRQLERYQEEYRQAAQQLAGLGFILQGSLSERWMQCGKPECGCHADPPRRHGPYHQWSWKRQGKTASIYLTPPQAELCQQGIANQRELERILKHLHDLSRRMLRLYGIHQS